MIKFSNAFRDGGNAVKRVFPGSTASQLNHFMHASLDDKPTTIICAGTNNLTKKKPCALDITKEVLSIVEICYSGRLKIMFTSSMTCRPVMKEK